MRDWDALEYDDNNFMVGFHYGDVHFLCMTVSF